MPVSKLRVDFLSNRNDNGPVELTQGLKVSANKSITFSGGTTAITQNSISAPTITASGFSGPLTGNVTGSLTGNADTVTNGFYTTSSFYLGTTLLPVNRTSAAITLSGVSIDGNSGTVTNGFYTTSSFYLGTTLLPVNRTSAAITLSGVSIDGNSGTATTAAGLTGSPAITVTTISGTTANFSGRITVSDAIQLQQDSISSYRLIFRGQPSSSYRWNIDNFSSSNNFRIFREDDATTANGFVAVSISPTGTLTATTVTGAITSGAVQASTSGTAINFPSIPSWVKSITVGFNNVKTSSTSPPLIQIGSSSLGYTNTGYTGSNSVISNGSAVTVNFTTGIGIGVNTTNWSSVQTVSGTVTFMLIDSVNNVWAASGIVGSSNGTVTWWTAGSKTLGSSNTLDRIRVTTSNGTDTFTNGSINIIYGG